MNKNKIKEFVINENDEIYKYYCEYRYQPTTILFIEMVKLKSEIDNLKGNINLYISGSVLLLTMGAVVVSIGSMGIAEYLNVVKTHMKLLIGYLVIGIGFLSIMPIYFYFKCEVKIKRMGIIEYILKCRECYINNDYLANK